MTFDYLWRLDGDSLYMVAVGSSDAGLTALDLANELAWREIPSRRIDWLSAIHPRLARLGSVSRGGIRPAKGRIVYSPELI